MSVAACSLILLSHTHILRGVSKLENAILCAINLASLSYQSICCSQMGVSEIWVKADATACVLMSTLKL